MEIYEFLPHVVVAIEILRFPFLRTALQLMKYVLCEQLYILQAKSLQVSHSIPKKNVCVCVCAF